MLEEIMTKLNNWFAVSCLRGTFIVQNGRIELPAIQEGQYFRVQGSVFNDGLHRFPDNEMVDETFDGEIWGLAIPRAVCALADEIDKWQEKNADIAASPFQSESFAPYSYTKATDGKTGGAVTWETVFRDRLTPWRKL